METRSSKTCSKKRSGAVGAHTRLSSNCFNHVQILEKGTFIELNERVYLSIHVLAKHLGVGEWRRKSLI
jgi:hypothetical protein